MFLGRRKPENFHRLVTLMNTLGTLEQLIRTTTASACGDDELQSAAALIAKAIRAETAYLVYGTDAFRKVGDAGDPREYDIKPRGYWLINRFLVKNSGIVAFNVVERRVVDLAVARPGLKRSHLAALVPMHEGASEMIVVGGLPSPLTKSGLVFLEAAAAILAPPMWRWTDQERGERQQRQVDALADVARVLSKEQSKEQTLTDLATAVAGASGFDSVTIAAFDETMNAFAYRALNDYRYTQHDISYAYRAGELDQILILLAKRRKPVLYADLPTDPRLDSQARRMLVDQALFVSLGVFPLLFRDELLGVMSLSDFTQHNFNEEEMTLLQGLAAQVAITIKGLDLYQELRAAKEKIEEYARRLEESMSIEHRLARTDSLTGVPNRRYLEEAIASECARALSSGDSLCVIMVDIDRFKEINDNFGHSFGDDVLKLVASLSWGACRNGEIGGRYGGDEFLFILPGTPADRAAKFAELFRETIGTATLFSPPGKAIGVTVSVGVAEADAECLCETSQIVERADSAMYGAKRQGGNRVVTFEMSSAPGSTN